MSGTVDIIKNGYPYSETFTVELAPTLDSNGNEVQITKTGLEFEMTLTAGIDLTTATPSVGTFNSITKVWTVPSITSSIPIYLSFIATVTDETLCPFQVVLTGTVLPNDSNLSNNAKTKILGGLSRGDILNEVSGLTGPTGAAGPTTDITIGTVTTGAAAAAITGTAPNLVLDLTLQDGPQGIQGIQGPVGVTDYTALTSRPNITTTTGGNITGEVNLTNDTFELTAPIDYVGLTGAENVAGVKTFDNGVVISDDSSLTGTLTVTGKVTQTSAPAVGIDLTNKTYVDAQIPVNVSELANDSGYVTANTQLTDEEVQDAMNTALVHAFHTDTNVVYDDVNNRFEITSTVVGGGNDGAITNMVQSADNLVVTGINGAFNGTINDVFKDTQNAYTFSRSGDNILIFENAIQIDTISIADTVVAVHTHPISDVTGLQSALDAKQDTLVSATNIKTVNGNSLVGAGDVVISSTYTHPNHTGEVTSTGDGATVVSSTVITNKASVTADAADEVLLYDASVGDLKRATLANITKGGGVGDSISQTFRGNLSTTNLEDRTFFFPKTTTQAGYVLKEISVYGELVTVGNMGVEIQKLDNTSVDISTYISTDRVKVTTIGDTDSEGYKVILSPSGSTTVAATIIGITLYYE